MDNILLIHIGFPKTGSTALQTFLYENSRMLEEYGWCYPDLKKELPEVEGMRGEKEKNGNFFFHEYRKIDIYTEDWNQKWKLVLKHLESKNVILSAEEFSWREVLNKFLIGVSEKWSNIKVIVYLRRQDRWIESGWNQLIKDKFVRHYDQPFLEHIKSNKETILEYCHYKRRLDQVEEIVGKGNLIVRVYEKQQFCGENHIIESDFLSVLNIHPDWSKWKKCNIVNSKLCGNYIEIKRIVNTIFKDENERNVSWISELIKMMSQNHYKFKEETGYFNLEDRKELLARFASDNEQVAKKYLHRNDGKLFYDNKIDYPVDDIHHCNSFEQDLICTFTMMLCKQNEMIYRQDKEIDQLKSYYNFFAEKLILQNSKGRKILLFGAGEKCRELLDKIHLPIAMIVDNNERKCGRFIKCVEIVHSNAIGNWLEYYTIITCVKTEEIEEQFQQMELKKEENYILAKEYFVYI